MGDYSQLEYRIVASVWPDANFIHTMLTSDLHEDTGITMWGKEEYFKDHEEKRVKAKNVNFGLVFGATEGTNITKQTGIPGHILKPFIERFWEKYPGIKAGQEATVAFALKHGYVESFTGRRRRFVWVPKDKGKLFQHQVREVKNHPIQGPAAEITLVAMKDISKELRARRAEGAKARVVNEIHDAVIVDTPSGELEGVAALMKQKMEGMTEEVKFLWNFQLLVPLKVELKVGPNWGNLKKLEV